ncbi:hypothetical protein EYF80_056587 [Liparis tanakae]|uniref:Uncharacterized protein n=1 Tax=Liparis tanakae TaxID=230148 RepID=A0A4Z2EWG5_9TELE|nr:hypothetical protein EYF80_056587 [Liparis tanakae]
MPGGLRAALQGLDDAFSRRVQGSERGEGEDLDCREAPGFALFPPGSPSGCRCIAPDKAALLWAAQRSCCAPMLRRETLRPCRSQREGTGRASEGDRVQAGERHRGEPAHSGPEVSAPRAAKTTSRRSTGESEATRTRRAALHLEALHLEALHLEAACRREELRFTGAAVDRDQRAPRNRS